MLSPLLFGFFIAACLITSIISAIFGMGGGILLIAVMANIFPAAKTSYIVPFHATIQMFSNFTRLLLFFKHIQWKVVHLFLWGMIPGALLGILIFRELPSSLIKTLMGFFILLVTFGPFKKKKKKKKEKGAFEGAEGLEASISVDASGLVEEDSPVEKAEPLSSRGLGIFIPVGFITGVLGIFFGATGPLIAPFYLRLEILKEKMIATKAFCKFTTHVLKIPLFAYVMDVHVLHFSSLLIFAIGAVILGTFLGKFVVSKVPEKYFKMGVEILLFLASCRLIYMGVMGMV